MRKKTFKKRKQIKQIQTKIKTKKRKDKMNMKVTPRKKSKNSKPTEK